MAKVAIQGGVKNYLPSKEVTVPVEAKSSKNHVKAHLAYITDKEQNLLIKKNFHGSLKGKPNRGPGGLPSLQGDFGPGGNNPGGFSSNQGGPGGTGNTGDKGGIGSGEESGFRDRGTGNYQISTKPEDQQAIKNYVQGKMDFQKGKAPGFFNNNNNLPWSTRNKIYNAKRNLAWADKQQARKIKGIDDLIAETYTANPHMDIAEIRDALMAQYDGRKGKETMAGLEGFNIGNPGMNYGPTQLGPLGLKTTNVKGEPMSTKHLSTTPSLDSRLSSPGLLGYALDKLQGPRNINNLMSSIDRFNQIDEMKTNGITQSEITDYYDKAQGKGKYDIFGGGGVNDNQPFVSFDPNTGAGTVEDVVEDKTFDYRFGNTQGIGRDVTDSRGYAANGGRIGRAFGGIMDSTTGRKAYGLGSIFKSVKKAVGKVLSSDVGKAAILGFGMFGVPGGSGWTGGLLKSGAMPTGWRNKLLMKNLAKKGADALYTGKGAGLDWWKVAGLAGAAAPFIKGPWNKVPENEDIGMGERGGQLIDPITKQPNNMAGMRENIELAKLEADGDPTKLAELNALYNNMLFTHVPYEAHGIQQAANGGRIGKAEGGLMDLGGMEKDYRAEGGFVPLGEYEKKDDVPARLSVNEFVFTADAVRGAGGGDIDKGAEIMENMMKNLEKGGTVSEESQGNTGAQQMFNISERLGEVI